MKASPDILAAIRRAAAEGRLTVGKSTAMPAGVVGAPPLSCSEAEFQEAVITLAQSLGYAVAHFRKVQVQRGGSTYWETPVAADGKGFPDLLLCRDRLLVAELKRDSKSDARLKPDQEAWRGRFARAGVEWHCWRPSMWDQIREVLA